MQVIPFTTGEYAAKFFLVGSRKIEFGEVSAGVDFLAAYAEGRGLEPSLAAGTGVASRAISTNPRRYAPTLQETLA